MDTSLHDASVLVTAASRGLGFATARLYAKEGAKVTIASRDETRLCEAASAIQTETGQRVQTVRLDVQRPEEISRAVQTAVDFGGGLDVLVCNSGGPPAGTVASFEDSAWYQAFDSNFMSVVRLVRASLDALKQSGHGRIVSITSTSIKQPISGLALSNTMRAGVLALTKTLASELAPFGVLVNTVGPGRISTERMIELDTLTANRTGETLEDVAKKSSERIPLGRYGSPDEFARAVVFLGSPANTYITGQALLVDGGMVTAL